MLWDSFLIKKLLKSIIYGTPELYTYALFIVDKVNYCGLNKKKKRREKSKGEMHTPLLLQSKRSLCPPKGNPSCPLGCRRYMKQKWASILLGISKTVVVLVGVFLVILAYPSCDPQFMFPFVAISWLLWDFQILVVSIEASRLAGVAVSMYKKKVWYGILFHDLVW